MSTLTAVLAHLPAAEVHERFALLRAVAPDARFVLCYGGPAEEFPRIELDDKLFIEDPTLRGQAQHLQSLTSTFAALWETYVAGDDDIDAVYLIEYDHLVLDPDFEQRLRDLAAETGADLLGKNCADRTSTNEEHYIRFRRDPGLQAHLRAVSVREDRERIYGCLGDGIWISRAALEAYLGVAEHPPCYCEVYVPTLVHHLGFRVVDVDAHGDLYRDVRWLPVFTPAEALARAADGAVFLHPVKDRGVVTTLLERQAAGARAAARD